MSIHQKEEQLFLQWENLLQTTTEIAYDGLLFKGNINYSPEGFWYRSPGDEEEMWKSATKRILVLSKELNDKESWDIRCETGRKNHTGENNVAVSTPFYRNYMKWLYGLLHTTRDGFPSYEEASRQDVFLPFFEQVPVARMNLKKTPGGASISNSVLKSFLKNDAVRHLIVKQMELYDANMILCCGGSGCIRKFVVENYCPDAEKINDRMWYSKSKRKVIIDSYHFSHRLVQKHVYDELMENWQDFIQSNCVLQ